MQIMPEINVDKLFMLPAAFVGTLLERERERENEGERIGDNNTSIHCGIYNV